MSAAPQLQPATTITRFRSLMDTQAIADATTWPSLFERFSRVRPFTGEKKHPGWSAATFEPPHRALANVRLVTALVLDYDNKAADGGCVADPITIERMQAELADYYALIHTSRSHKPDWPRFRVVLPLGRPVSREEYAQLWRGAASRWPGVDPQPKDPSRFWYEPGIEDGGYFEFAVLTGAFLDPDELIAAAPPMAAPAPLAKAVPRTGADASMVDRARKYIERMPPAISGSGGHASTFNVARKLVQDFGLDDSVALELLREYNQRCVPQWSERELLHKLNEAREKATVSNPIRDRNPRAIAWSPTQDRPVLDYDEQSGEYRKPPAATEQAEQVAGPGSMRLTETGNGERLVKRYGRVIRYCNEREKWLTYDGSRWLWDDTKRIEQLAKATARALYAEAAKCEVKNIREAIVAHAKASEKMSARSAMLRAAMSEPGIPVRVSDLDLDPYLLNCRNGTLDLRTGVLRPHDGNDLITKTTGLDYDPEATSELWDRVLMGAVGGNVELAEFLQRAIGYALIGLPLERVFFFLYGPGGTAKTTLINAFMAALGEYAMTADFETWLLRNTPGGNRGDLVRLAGARLVTSAEGRHGARWDESLIKRVTGGDVLTCAAKFENEVSFLPSFTILIAANDAPSARDDDGALWDRLRRCPITTVIPKEQRDPTIKEQLKEPEHAAAVLAWAVRGCLEYQRGGLGSAKVVDDSTAAYHAENDHFGEFLADEFEFASGGFVTRKLLSTKYANWCEETGRKSRLSAKEIAKRLRASGCEERKRVGERGWIGLCLATEGS